MTSFGVPRNCEHPSGNLTSACWCLRVDCTAGDLCICPDCPNCPDQAFQENQRAEVRP